MTDNFGFQAQETDDFGFESLDDVIESEKEEMPQYLGRQVLRTGSRALETLAGLPGDIQELTNSIIGYGLGKAGVSDETIKKLTEGKQYPQFTPEVLMAQGMSREEAEKFSKSYTQPALGGRFPRSQELKEGMQQFEILRPQSEAEERLDELTEDVAALYGPGNMKFMTALGTSLAAQAGGETVKAFGGGEKGKQLTKLGVIGIASILDQPGVKKHIGKLYEKSKKAIPEGDLASAVELKNDLSRLRKEILKGSSKDPEKAAPLGIINELLYKIEQEGGKLILAEELVEFNKSINSRLKTKWVNPVGDVERADRWYLDSKKAIDKALNGYGKNNPAFIETYREANQAYQGMRRANSIQNYIYNKINTSSLSKETKLLLGLHFLNPKLLVAGGTQLAVGQAYNLAARYLENPALRKIYNQIIKAAATKNSAALTRNVNLLDKAIEKEKD